MKALRIATAIVTLLMSLLNLPFAFEDGINPVVGWVVTLFGVIGIVVAVGLLRKASWGPWAVVAIGIVNLAGAVLALARDQDGAMIGLLTSAVITVLGLTCVRAPQPA
jgi:hypothetical protein